MKVFTTLCIAASVLLLLALPAVVARRPRSDAQALARRRYATSLLAYTGGLILTLVGAGAGSILIVRQARRSFREESARNLGRLIDPTSSDTEATDGG